MRDLVVRWANQNTGTRHTEGLHWFTQMIHPEFRRLTPLVETLDFAPQATVDQHGKTCKIDFGHALRARKRPEADRKIFLGIHTDTVFPVDDPFQTTEWIDAHTLRGPGVADAKGGLAVLLIALEAFEQSPWAKKVGWEVLLNPDEEIGSPGSGAVLEECGRRNHIGLIFEPALSDGNLVSSRKGSGNFTVVIRGQSAHAGRDIHRGRNAVHAMADMIQSVAKLQDMIPGATVNVGNVWGGGAVNVVPDLAVCQFNIRVTQRGDQEALLNQTRSLVNEIDNRDGFSAMLHGSFTAPPKPLDEPMSQLLNMFADCGQKLGMTLNWRESGGVSDGNRLAATGLPVVDSLGPVGGNLHSANEFVRVDTLTERAKLTALFLMRLAAGEFPWPDRTNRVISAAGGSPCEP
jgi:glutamate carboxypeptidase